MENTNLTEYVPYRTCVPGRHRLRGPHDMTLTHVLGPRERAKPNSMSLECGIESKGNARIPFNIKYFLVAISLRPLRC